MIVQTILVPVTILKNTEIKIRLVKNEQFSREK